MALANLNLTERARFQRGEKVRVRVRVRVKVGVRVSSWPNLTLILTLALTRRAPLGAPGGGATLLHRGRPAALGE